MDQQNMLNNTLNQYNDIINRGIIHCEKAIDEGKIYRHQEDTVLDHWRVCMAMMINRLKDALEIFQELNLLTKTAASNFYREESSDIGFGGDDDAEQEEQTIAERLAGIERKVDLLVDTLGGEGNYHNGHYVCNDLFDIQTAAEAIEEFLKYGFPEAAKRAETNKREYEEAMKRLAKRFRERSIR